MRFNWRVDFEAHTTKKRACCAQTAATETLKVFYEYFAAFDARLISAYNRTTQENLIAKYAIVLRDRRLFATSKPMLEEKLKRFAVETRAAAFAAAFAALCDDVAFTVAAAACCALRCARRVCDRFSINKIPAKRVQSSIFSLLPWPIESKQLAKAAMIVR